MPAEAGIQRTSPHSAPKGGASTLSNNTLVNTGVAVKSSPGRLWSIHAHNLNAAVRYLKIYNIAAPNQSHTPVFRFPIPASGFIDIPLPMGADFSTAIGIRVTTGAADNDNGAPTSGETIVNITFS